MACVNKSNTDNFLIWNKVAGSLTLAQLQASGMPTVCDNISVDMPTNLTASNPTLTTLDLAWESFSNTIEIHRSTDNITFSLIDTLTDSETSYVDTGLSQGSIYYYKVRSVGFISSPYSDTAIGFTIIDFGLALAFDGVNDYVDLGSMLNGVSISEDFTYSLWFKIDGTVQPSGSGLCVNYNSSDSTRLSFQFNTAIIPGFPAPTQPDAGKNVLNFLFRGVGGSNRVFVSSGQLTPDTEWHNAVVTRSPINATDFECKLFIDGVLENTLVSEKSRHPVTYGAENYIGRNREASTEFKGTLDNVAIVANSMSDGDIADIWNGSEGSTFIQNHANLLALYKFNKAGATGGADNTLVTDVTVADDSSGNGYDGTLTNFALTGSTSNYVDHD